MKAYVFGAPEDPERTWRLVELLTQHGIRVHHLAREIDLAGTRHEAGSSFVVPLAQPQFRLVRALFETRTSWDDNTFYDVSSWCLPFSFGVPSDALDAGDFSDDLLGDAWSGRPVAGTVESAERAVAWIFEWHHYAAPAALQTLLEAGVRARVATRRFSVEVEGGRRAFDYGTIVIAPGVQDMDRAALREHMAEVAALGLDVYAARSGLTYDGVDLGSSSLRTLTAPEALLLVGAGVSGYEAGEVWHYLDTRVGLAVSMVERDAFPPRDFGRYTHLLLVNGATGDWGERERDALRDWVGGGGVVVATKSAAVWAAEHLLENEEPEEPKEDEDESEESEEEGPPAAYLDYEDLSALQRVSGTIFQSRLDLTHPLCFGYVRECLPVFRNSTDLLPEGEDPFGTPVRYTDKPLLSGFASEENVELIAGSPAVRAARVGAGSVICMVDNPNFRGVWYGTNRLYTNAIYFGPALKPTGPIEVGAARGR